MKKYGFGVDIGGTSVKIGLFEMTGELLEKWEIKTNTENGGAAILDDVAAAVLGKLEEKAISKDDVEGIGVGVPGPVGKDGTVFKCVNLGWGVFNVSTALTEKTGLHVLVGNDANVAALGELWQGGGKGHKDLVMLTLGTGIGGGIIIDGKILGGAHGAGGEIGHIKIDDTELESCGCGGYGCFEQYCSATGIARLAKKHLPTEERDTPLKECKRITAKNIFDEAKAGDPVALDIVKEVTTILGGAMANIAAVVDPEIFVIGGGVSKAGDILITDTKKAFQKKAFHACRDTEITLAQLGNDAGMYGCCGLLL